MFEIVTTFWLVLVTFQVGEPPHVVRYPMDDLQACEIALNMRAIMALALKAPAVQTDYVAACVIEKTPAKPA